MTKTKKTRAALTALGAFALAASTTTFAASAHAKQSVTLNCVFLNAGWGTDAQTLAQQYYKETGVKVNITLVGRDTIHQKLALAIAGKANYDIFNVDYPWVPEFASQGDLYPLTNFIQKYHFDTSAFVPRALELGQWDGKNGDFGGGGTQYGIPATIHPEVLWYNTKLFNDATFKAQFKAKYGYDLAPPKTFKQFTDIAQFFNGKVVNGQKIYGWAAQSAQGAFNIHTWLNFVYSNTGDVINWKTMKSSLQTSAVIQATNTWAEAMKYTPPGITDYTFAEVGNDAAQGKLAMAIQWSWLGSSVDDPTNSKTVGQWNFVQIPKIKESVPHLAGWVDVIPKTSQHPDDAFKFIAWLENAKNSVWQDQNGGGDPVRQADYKNSTLLNAKIPGTKTLKFRRYPAVELGMKTAKARPFFPHEEEWETTLTPYLMAIETHQMSVNQALEKADAAVNSMLSKYYH